MNGVPGFALTQFAEQQGDRGQSYGLLSKLIDPDPAPLGNQSRTAVHR